MLRRLWTSTNLLIASLFFFAVLAWGSTLTIQPSTADNYFCSGTPTVNFGNLDYLDVGSVSAGGGGSGGSGGWLWKCFEKSAYATAADIFRSTLKFNFSALPNGATITSSKLYLYYSYGFGTVSGRTYWAYRLTRTDWSESQSTWNIFKTGSNWTNAGGDYSTTNGASITMPGSYGWVNWDVTAQVQYAQANVSKIAHFLIKDGSENSGIFGSFNSNNYTTNPSLCPYLVITFTAPGGGGGTLFFGNG